MTSRISLSVRRSTGRLLQIVLLICIVAHGTAAPSSIKMLFTWNARGQTGLAPVDTAEPASPWIRRWATVAEGSGDSSTIVMDLGNTLYPGYLSRFSYGSLMAEILGQARLSARRVTIRDFHQGRERLCALAERATYPFVCTNLIDTQTGKTLFAPSARVEVGGLTLRVLSVIRSQGGSTRGYLDREAVRIEDPVMSLRSFIAADSASAPDITVCLCDEATLSAAPGILGVSGIDLVVSGTESFSSSARPAPRLEELENGIRVVHVPPFQTGFGRLELEVGHDRRTTRYAIDTTIRDDVGGLARLEALHGKWSALYRRESADTLAIMAEAVESDQVTVVGNLLREMTRAELAVFDRALVAGAPLPATITIRDLDRMLNASPDLYRLQLSGADIRRVDNIEGLVWIGIAGGKVEGRSLSSNETYRVVATEEAKDAIMERLHRRASLPRAAPLFIALDEALQEQLTFRKRSDYDFRRLDLRPRLSAELELKASGRRVTVRNPDSVTSLPGAAYESFSAWDTDVRLPLTFHNRRHELTFEPRLQYAAAGEKVGRNDLELRLDYTFGTIPSIKPYVSARYRSYVALRPGESRPVKLRTTMGAQSGFSGWEFRIGFGAEKGIAARDPNPFVPFLEVLRDTLDTWGPGVEFSCDGSYSLSRALHRRGIEFFRYRDLSLKVHQENYLGSSRRTARFQGELDLELVIQLIAPVKLEIGYRIFYAHLFADERTIYNLQPSLTFTGSYGFKW